MDHVIIKEVAHGAWALSRIFSVGAFTGRSTYPDAATAQAVALAQDLTASVEIVPLGH